LKQCITLHKNSGGAVQQKLGELQPLSPIAGAATGVLFLVIYCKTLYFRCILLWWFWSVNFWCILIWHFLRAYFAM